MVQINGYSGDIPPQKGSGTPTGSTGSSYASAFYEYRAKQQEEYAKYQAQQKSDYEAYVQEQKAGLEALKQKGNAAKGTNPADVSKANADYAAALRNPDNWQDVQSKFPQKPVTTESAPVDTTDKSEGTPKLTDYITGLSDEAKTYLNNSEQFKGFEKEYTALIQFQLIKEQELPGKQEALLAAKQKFEKTPYSDFDAKSAAQKEYFAAQKEYDDVLGSIHGAEKDSAELMKNILSYASVINSWKDGTVIVSNRQSVGTGQSNVFNREYTRVTLPNGEKAYESNGKYYQLNEQGLPNHDKLIES